MEKIQIIVGSATGTAQRVAEHLAEAFSSTHSVEVNSQANSDHLTRDAEEFLLFCTSNTGAGDLPENILSLYIELTTFYPKIAGRKYALINLGDSSFPTYGEAGEHLDKALQDLGAVPVTESCLIDAMQESEPEKVALAWARGFI